MGTTAEDVLAENLVWFRKARGVSQETIARAMQEIGLAWSRSTVAAIEGGARRVSLGELLTLAYVLGAPVAELLTPRDDDGAPIDSWVELAPGLRVRDPSTLLTGELAAEDVRQRDVAPETTTPNLADRLAAEKLEITVDEVVARAHRLWGKSLTEKRDELLVQRVRKHYPGMRVDELAPERAEFLQALRGHITRELYRQLSNRRTKR